jgi:hypothetical protein
MSPTLILLAALAVEGPDARQLFETRCAPCHVPPDPGFAPDRAFVSHVAGTA